MEEERHENVPIHISIPDDSSSITNSSNNSREQSLMSDSNPISKSSVKIKTSLEDDRSMLLQSPTYEAKEFDEDVDFEHLLRILKRVWTLILCTAGILDILAYIEPTLRRSYENGRCTSIGATIFGESFSNLFWEGLEVDGYEKASVPFYCSTLITFLDRLREYNIVISFAFSLLWFFNSQAKARNEYYNVFAVREDRLELLSPATGDENENGTRERKRKKKFSARNHYYRRILSSMLVLPVGFYVILYRLIRGLINGEWLYRELLIKHANDDESVFLTVQDAYEFVTIEISEDHAKVSTIFAIYIYLKYIFLLATEFARSEFKTSVIPGLRRKIVFSAAKNPRIFIRKIKRLLKYARWLRYILPIAGKLNKLRVNALATLSKRRQYKLVNGQKRVIMELQKKKSITEIEEDSAILIQRFWRSHQDSMYLRAAARLSGGERRSAATTIQRAFRKMSLISRSKISQKRRELTQLVKLKRQKSIKKMNDEERRRLYELQDEFVAEAKKTINKRLLMKPNTRLSYLFNSLFIFCLLMEISFNALKPWLLLPKAERIDNVKYKSMRYFLVDSLTPRLVEETATCKDFLKKRSPIERLFYGKYHIEQPTRQEVMSAFIEEISDPDYGLERIHNVTNHTSSKKKMPWRCGEPMVSFRNGYRDAIILAFHPKPVSEWPICKEEKMSLVGKIIEPFRRTRKRVLPWYCSKPYSVFHYWYSSTWNFIVDQILFVISIILFFDVFVRFFYRRNRSPHRGAQAETIHHTVDFSGIALTVAGQSGHWRLFGVVFPHHRLGVEDRTGPGLAVVHRGRRPGGVRTAEYCSPLIAGG